MDESLEMSWGDDEDAVVDRWIDEIVPEELDWQGLVRSYPKAALLVVAAGGFYLGKVHGSRIVDAVSDLVTRRVQETADRLTDAVQEAG